MSSRLRLTGSAAVLLLLLPMFTGCVPKAFIVKNMDPIILDMNVAVNRNTDVDQVRDALPANLLMLDGLITASPYNNLVLLTAAEGYFGYSLSFVEDNDKERASALYLKARDYAVRALVGKGPSSTEFFDEPLDKIQESINGMGKSDVPALYWTSTTWMIWAGLNLNKPETLMAVPKIEAMLLRCVELDETFYNGGAHAALGAFYASRAKVIGGDPEKSQAHFKKAFEISKSKILFYQQMYAQYYCYQIQDRDLFEKTLKQVIDAPVNFYPDKNFPNEVAKRKAKALLGKADDLF